MSADPGARPAAEGLSCFAPAKVNLFLHVTGRRADGYHLLDSLVAFAGTGDVLRARFDGALSLAVEGPFAAGLPAPDAGAAENLVLRAARALSALTGQVPRAALVLDKRLPVASGIGGGSADAAASLRLLQSLWGVAPHPDELAALALRLGADVPVCLASRPARMQGVGELLSAVPPLPPLGLVLVNPGVAVSTRAVFEARAASAGGAGPFGARPAPSLPAGWADAAALAGWLGGTGNDLEDAALALCPPVGAVLAALRARPGCLLARMSGSGATCFALFADAGEAERAAAALPQEWWRWGGGLAA
ncbi:MAG: 4-(cytidine 5'-diphospho)-2-C-methyl-D-erythritol kinase [Janthinobacterium lividum]